MYDQQNYTFEQWLNHWGEDRFQEHLTYFSKHNKRKWDRRNEEGTTRSYPVWELTINTYWKESDEEWQERWRNYGGEFFDTRMMAPIWSPIWEKIGRSFTDGFGRAYPPYARYTCANFNRICDDEAIVLGVISEDEYQARLNEISQPKKQLLDKNGIAINFKELLGDKYEEIQALKDMSREDRLAYKREQMRAIVERSTEGSLEYAKQRAAKIRKEQGDKNTSFRQLENIERKLNSASGTEIEADSSDLLSSLDQLTKTTHFEDYPKWSARAWKLKAKVYQSIRDESQEIEALKHAIAMDSKIGVKRRLNTLTKRLNG